MEEGAGRGDEDADQRAHGLRRQDGAVCGDEGGEGGKEGQNQGQEGVTQRAVTSWW